MEWLRWYHGTVADPKLRMVAADAGQPVHLTIAVWTSILEHASVATPRGTCHEMSRKVTSFNLQAELEAVDAIFEAMTRAGMLMDGRVEAWERRQPKREDDGATDRKRQQRQRDRENVKLRDAELSADSPAVSRPVTQSHDRGEEIRGDSSVSSLRSETAEPGNMAPAPDARQAIWTEMKQCIGGRTPGSLIGKWVKQYREGLVVECHFAAMRAAPADYVEWMTKSLAARARASPGSSNRPADNSGDRWRESQARKAAEKQAEGDGLHPGTPEHRTRVTEILNGQSADAVH